MNKLIRLIMNESVESRPQSLMGWEGVGVTLGLTRLYPLPQSRTLKYYNLKLKKEN